MEGLNCAKIRRTYSAPPDSFEALNCAELRGTNNHSENNSIETLLHAFYPS